MNRNTNFAALVEKNRIALLRIVFCWLSMAFCVNGNRDKALPRRLSSFVENLIFKAEQATGWLLISVFYLGQRKRQISFAYENAAQRLIAANRGITLGTLTIFGIIKRLKALQHLLINLHAFSRRLAKSIAARARVLAMKVAALANVEMPNFKAKSAKCLCDDAVPP